MGRWGRVTDRLDGVAERVRWDWAELEELVGPLPASATNHRAWWSGDRPHVQAWRRAGFTLGRLAPGEFVEFVRSGATPPRPTATTLDGPGRARSNVSDADLLLMSCVKTKLTVPAAAKDLYISASFVKQRRYAETSGLPWFILSAKYGLVAPEEWIEPYELYLPTTSPSYRASWGTGVVDRLAELVGPLGGTTVEIHAGRPYLEAIAEPLRARGVAISAPLDGLRSGERLHWYVDHAHES